MDRKIIYIPAIITVAALSLASCVKDDLYDTPHPDKGKVAVTADWSSRGENVEIPGLWRAVIGDYTAEVTGSTHEAERLFEPGDYRLITYNPADGITVAGTTATISAASGERGNAFISGSPDWFFAGVHEITVEKDREHAFTAAMLQQIRQLTLLLEPAGTVAAAIEDIAGGLSGVAGTLDFATGTYGGVSDVELDFKKITEGADAGKWKATVRMLGIAGDTQRLFGNGDIRRRQSAVCHHRERPLGGTCRIQHRQDRTADAWRHNGGNTWRSRYDCDHRQMGGSKCRKCRCALG